MTGLARVSAGCVERDCTARRRGNLIHFLPAAALLSNTFYNTHPIITHTNRALPSKTQHRWRAGPWRYEVHLNKSLADLPFIWFFEKTIQQKIQTLIPNCFWLLKSDAVQQCARSSMLQADAKQEMQICFVAAVLCFVV